MAEKTEAVRGKSKPSEPEQTSIQPAGPEPVVGPPQREQTTESFEENEKSNTRDGVVKWGTQGDTLPYYLL